jgi:hypothetical protein
MRYGSADYRRDYSGSYSDREDRGRDYDDAGGRSNRYQGGGSAEARGERSFGARNREEDYRGQARGESWQSDENYERYQREPWGQGSYGQRNSGYEGNRGERSGGPREGSWAGQTQWGGAYGGASRPVYEDEENFGRYSNRGEPESHDQRRGGSYGGGYGQSYSDRGSSGESGSYGDGGRGNRGSARDRYESDSGILPGGRYGYAGVGGGEWGGYSGPNSGSQQWSGGQWGWAGTHSGQQRRNRGPKGYTRSDERIREDISDRLMQQDRLDPSEIEIQVRDGEVTLTGTVCCRSEKFHIEELADSIPGVKEVTNQIRVKREDSRADETTSSTASSSYGGSGASSSGSDAARSGRKSST